jgi:hypothetical protein
MSYWSVARLFRFFNERIDFIGCHPVPLGKDADGLSSCYALCIGQNTKFKNNCGRVDGHSWSVIGRFANIDHHGELATGPIYRFRKVIYMASDQLFVNFG